MKNICFLFFFSMSICLVTNAQKNLIDKILTEEEAKTIYQIITFYDTFVLSQTDTNLPIDKAYTTLLENNVRTMEAEGDLSPIIPDDEFLIPFQHSLNKEHLSEIFKDSSKHFNRDSSYYVYLFSINLQGKFIDFVKKLGKRKKIFKPFYDDAMSVGDIITSTALITLLHEYKHIHLNKKDERLIYAIVFLFYPRTIYLD